MSVSKNPFANAPRPHRPTVARTARGESNADRAASALRREVLNPRRNVDLRKIREGLGLTPQYLAALAGISDMTLLHCEEQMDDSQMVDDVLAVLALFMATRWGADILNLTEDNLSEKRAS